MINKKNRMVSLLSDYYQYKMIFANVILGKGNEEVGFEGFVRDIKGMVNQYTNFYIFAGEKEVKQYIKQFKKEIKTKKFLKTFIKLIKDKVTSPDKDELIKKFKKNFKKLNFDFDFTVMKDGDKIFKNIPVFQYRGPRVWGQLIETYVTNIYNGKSGLATLKWLKNNGYDIHIDDKSFEFINDLLDNKTEALNIYRTAVDEKAKEFRESTNKIILEAGFRRAPNYQTALIATETAIKNGWEGTSNTSAYFDGNVDLSKINGTIAHAFIMGFKTEKEAILGLNKIFPETSMPVDTYNVINCVNTIKEMVLNKEIKPLKDVRIDSSPLDLYCIQTNEILKDINIDNYISGDVTCEMLIDFDKREIPYRKAMVGTKFVYAIPVLEKINCGFVYKLVKQEINGETIYPEKKSTDKSNVPGLKYIVHNKEENIIYVHNKQNKFGFVNYNNIKNDVIVKFMD